MLTIIVVQYEPNWEKMERTLLSIVQQSDQNFELVIADDGSKKNLFQKARKWLESRGRHAVYLALDQNRGTVWNLWNAVSHASGKWVYSISPGDYLYDSATVAWIKAVCEQDQLCAGFGRAAYYTDTPRLRCLPGQTPCDRTCYRKGSYRPDVIKRHLLLYDDGISGACVFYRRDLLLAALNKMKGHVQYAEDFSLRMFAVQGIPINCYDRNICWYEADCGVSKSKEIMQADWRAMLLVLRKNYPRDLTVRLAALYYFNEEQRSRILRGIVGRLIVPQWIPLKQKQKHFQPPVNGKLEILQDLYKLQMQGGRTV